MLEIKTEITIDSPVEKVWQALVKFQGYPEWNPFITDISGELKLDATLNVFICPPNKKGMRFKPKLIKVELNKELRWVGKLGLAAVFQGEHYFLLEAITPQQTKFIHGEIFSGWLVPLLKKDLTGPTMQGFIAMNEALKTKLHG